jgi:integrase
MSLSPASRKPDNLPHRPSLAEVREMVLADEGLSLRRRQDVSSALRTLAKALGHRLDELPAHPGYLRERLERFTPAMAGLSPRRWRNALSLTRFALKHAKLARVPGRYEEPLTPAWADLFRYLNDARMRVGLSRLARWCGARGIGPDQVNDEVLGVFLAELCDAGIVKRPRTIHRTACILWNKAATQISSWPKQSVTVPQYRRDYVKPWSTFPPSLKADVEAYLDRLAGKDIFAELDFRPLKPGSVQTRARQLHQFVSALVLRGRDPQTLCSLRDVVAVPVVMDGLRFYVDRPEGKAMKHAQDLAYVLLAVARHWVKVDPEHLAALKKICRRLDHGRGQMTETNRAKLRQFDDPANVRALVTLPERLLAKSRSPATPSRAQALKVQTAVAIELLLMVPIRLGNLARLDMDRHLIRSVGGGAVHLAIPGSEVKNGVNINAVLPGTTVRLIDLYIERYRPVLANERSRWLFPGESDGPKSRHGLGHQISSCIKRECGLNVHPHLFRHIAAKLYLDAHPGAYGVVRLVHGHKSVDTTTRYYCGMETQSALRHFDEHILKLRTQSSAASIGGATKG